jgi:hypothetical protein
VIAVDEVHVGATGRTEENGISRRPARRRVRRCVALAEIGFGFDDSSGENSARRFSDEQFPQQGARHAARIAIEEVRLEQSDTVERSHGIPQCLSFRAKRKT